MIIISENNINKYKHYDLKSKIPRFKDNDIVILDTYNKDILRKTSNSIQILLIDKIILDSSILNLVNYILPTDLLHYFSYYRKYNWKLLFPVNLHNSNKTKIYGYDSDNEDECFMFLYEHLSELQNLKQGNKYILEKNDKINLDYYKFMNEAYIKNDFFELNNFINMRYSQNNYIVLNNKYNSETKYKLQGGKLNILKREGTKIYSIENVLFEFYRNNFYLGYKSIVYKIDAYVDKELMIIIRPEFDMTMTLGEILKDVDFKSNFVVGDNYDELDYVNLYYVFGQGSLWDYYFPVSKFNHYYQKFIDKQLDKYNFRKLERVVAFNQGLDNLLLRRLDRKKLNYKMDKCLLVSKLIKGYGGNQKTSRQLYEFLEKTHDVYIWSMYVPKHGHYKTKEERKELEQMYGESMMKSKTTYDFKKDELCPTLHNEDIIKTKVYMDTIKHINETDYKYIINNKNDGYFDIIEDIKLKSSIITHNSMDPINRLIINKQKYLDKVYTINRIHKKLFRKNGLVIQLTQYINYVEEEEMIKPRTQFKNQIVFVGRLSKEKNTDLLLETWKSISRCYPQLKLVVLGDGKDHFFKDVKNVEYYGRVDYNVVKLVLLNSDYLILSSTAEGLPFTILESMCLGIPCICSNINGINEVVRPGKTGFLFRLEGYEDCKKNIDNWDVIKSVDERFRINKISLFNVIVDAYAIEIEKWNEMSRNCHALIQNNFLKRNVKL